LPPEEEEEGEEEKKKKTMSRGVEACGICSQLNASGASYQ
jgi:hypothetical protein